MGYSAVKSGGLSRKGCKDAQGVNLCGDLKQKINVINMVSFDAKRVGYYDESPLLLFIAVLRLAMELKRICEVVRMKVARISTGNSFSLWAIHNLVSSSLASMMRVRNFTAVSLYIYPVWLWYPADIAIRYLLSITHPHHNFAFFFIVARGMVTLLEWGYS